MGMGEHTDTAIVTAEQKQQNGCRICPEVFHPFFQKNLVNVREITDSEKYNS